MDKHAKFIVLLRELTEQGKADQAWASLFIPLAKLLISMKDKLTDEEFFAFEVEVFEADAAMGKIIDRRVAWAT